jgi:release factor glutamine methyltransferase
LILKNALELYGNTIETRLILKHVLNISDSDFIINLDMEININTDLAAIFNKRKQGFPLAYLTSEQFFWKHNFYVNENVLIPRQDSETLVAAFLEYFPQNSPSRAKGWTASPDGVVESTLISILEIGIGSGCLLLSLLDEYKNSIGCGVDISSEALAVSLKNAQNLQVDSRLRLVQSNLFEKVDGVFDVIISNPPYISPEDTDIADDVKKFEPNVALFADNNGLFFYEKILEQAGAYLKKDGLIFLEIGYKQNSAVVYIAQENGFKHLATKKDLAGHDRAVVLQRV